VFTSKERRENTPDVSTTNETITGAWAYKRTGTLRCPSNVNEFRLISRGTKMPVDVMGATQAMMVAESTEASTGSVSPNLQKIASHTEMNPEPTTTTTEPLFFETAEGETLRA
jgi:hypothetical protein